MTPTGYVTYIAVRSGWENAGIARFMMHHLIHTSVDKDITLHVRATNRAMIFYQKFGFKPEAFIVNFYDTYLSKDSKQNKNAFFIRLRK
jgi:ribosomal protein S18 acetylase RimI-like enzyme